MYIVLFQILLPPLSMSLRGVHLNARLCVVVETALLLGSHHIDGFHKVLVHDDRGFPKRRTRGVILRERKRRE
jgi:hypothetical protein